MTTMQGNQHYHRFLIGILTATLWLTVSANYADYPTECPKNDPMNYTILLPHETDCEKFYACYHGKKIVMLCPLMDLEGNRLHFSPTLHVCDYPDNAGCEPPSTTTEESAVTTENSPSNHPTATATTTITPTPTPPTTTTTTLTPTTTPTPTTAEQPTSSTEGSTDEAPMTTTELPPVPPVVSTNNPSTTIIISSTTEQSTLSTGSRSSEPPITSTTERPTSLTGSSSDESSTTSTSKQPTSSIKVSTNEPSTTTTIEISTGTTPSSSSPTSDIANNSTEEMPTTSELPLTSSATSLSTASNAIDTTNSPTGATTASVIGPMCTQNTTEVFFPHESHPNLYYECTHGDLIRRECDTNFVFDVSQQGCVQPPNRNYLLKLFNLPRIFNTEILSNAVNLCNSTNSNSSCERHPHEYDCTKYYICANGNAVLRMCPSSLNFNPKLKECDLPGRVNCDGGNINPNNTIPTECPSDNSGWAVHLAHETNCSLFYKCNWGKKIELPCRSGLYFNPILQVCDYPCAAGCTVESGDGTNTCHTHIHPSNITTTIKQNPMLNVDMSDNSIYINNQ